MANAPAVLFDIDGTLVDSNYLHVHAWCRAFDEAGVAVESWRIHRSIGMDGNRLINRLSGDADETHAERPKIYTCSTSRSCRLCCGPCPVRANSSNGCPGTRPAGGTGQLGQ